jgi:hypothetical protein
MGYFIFDGKQDGATSRIVLNLHYIAQRAQLHHMLG